MSGLKMVVFTKELMSQSLEQFIGIEPATSSELQECTDASLVCTTSSDSLHNVIDGKRLTQPAHRKDFKILTYSRFRSYFISVFK